MRLKDKVAVVTGAAGGIGSAICRRFAEEGGRVVMADINEKAARQLETELTQIGFQAWFRYCRVDSPTHVRSFFLEVERRYGGIDILINNAMCSNDDIHANRFDAVVNVGFRGAVLCTDMAIESMRRRGGGSIVNVSSVNGLGGFGDVHVYSGVKAGIIGYSRSLAVALGSDGIRVNAICPGTVETAAWDNVKATDPDIYERLRQKYPLGRLGKPVDIANAALFLASDEAAFVTGAVLVVDGGLTAGLPGFLE